MGEAVAQELGLDEAYTQLLPGDKVERVEALLQETSPKGKLAFVGDGINDAPVLSRADIGIAMGALGSDAAIEAADLVLMDDKPSKIAKAMEISQAHAADCAAEHRVRPGGEAAGAHADALWPGESVGSGVRRRGRDGAGDFKCLRALQVGRK